MHKGCRDGQLDYKYFKIKTEQYLLQRKKNHRKDCSRLSKYYFQTTISKVFSTNYHKKCVLLLNIC